MKTKGAILWNFNEPWSIEEIEIGDPREGEVKVQIEAAGMCHSDHHLVTGAIPMAGFPVLGGHEGAGIITETGPGVRGLEVGDHVVMSFVPSCGQCPSCREGMHNLCDLGALSLGGASASDGSFRVTANGRNAFPMCLLGTFSPYAVVNQMSVVKIDTAIPFELACIVGCGVPTGYGSATTIADVRPGEDVAIVGLGGVGMAALQGAVNSGARHVLVVEPVEWKRDQAVKFGASAGFATIEAATAGAAEITAGRMCKKVIVTVGELKGQDVDKYMGITAKGGTCVLTAMGAMTEDQTTLNTSMLCLLQKTLKGSLFGGGNPQYDIGLMLSLYRAGRLNLDDMVTREYALEQVNDGYRDMLAGRNIRGIIRFTDADR
ncbi:NDMA-dependent alcohol dehydrogenase [Mycolicibacterium stellerae]|uniref:NDMA-dependent alcohol dehydrogenase n=1 Tax=Mycolicibacterium stellerae TaxID=2358193 RepID=UPI000F0B034D|nr:NDMA-dependent alcohol dehydrogenase [Mycolicibacterium stellerae]